MNYPDEPATPLTTRQISDRLQGVIETLTQIHNEHALERAICAQLIEQKDEEIARLTALSIELLNLTTKEK